MRSLLEDDVVDSIRSYYSGEIVLNCRDVLPYNREIDIYLPECSMGLEVNGDLWHSDAAIDYFYGMSAESYHSLKFIDAELFNVDLGFVWEWDLMSRNVETLSLIKDSIIYGRWEKEFKNFIGERDADFNIDDIIDAEDHLGVGLSASILKNLSNVEKRIIRRFFGFHGGLFGLNAGFIAYSLKVDRNVVDDFIDRALMNELIFRIDDRFIVNPRFVISLGKAEREGIKLVKEIG